MSENMRIWDALKKTDPSHTKPFKRAGGFSGTSVKPIHMTEKMTRQFGPSGTGWGMFEPSFQVIQAGEEIAVYCTVGLWYGPEKSTVYGVGGDFVLKKFNNGKAFADDEAFKKAYTDALGNAMKHLGMAADIHMGQHDDDKYVTALRREIEAENGNGKAPKETTESIRAFEHELAERLVKTLDEDALNALWRNVGGRVKAIGQADADANKRIVKMFSDRKAEIQARAGNTVLAAG